MFRSTASQSIYTGAIWVWLEVQGVKQQEHVCYFSVYSEFYTKLSVLFFKLLLNYVSTPSTELTLENDTLHFISS